ncbi:hypothetical protein [Ensifer oleiphilus]|uniref:two-partner secretion domain-containing protein n=1 Tax=Ensifer oleiphilus TaxID=2742698 RepID=UPI001AED5B7F|nr:hypothetical protein [Ensifer oleiphilus]
MGKRYSSVMMALVGSTALSTTVLAGDLPTGGTVVSGSGSISTQGSTLTVHQTSDRLVTNWNSFSISSANSVVFQQPSSSSVALNRVIGVDLCDAGGKTAAQRHVDREDHAAQKHDADAGSEASGKVAGEDERCEGNTGPEAVYAGNKAEHDGGDGSGGHCCHVRPCSLLHL